MSIAWTVVALAALGVDVGWQPLSTGGMEYIIQIEPDSLDTLLNGQDIISDVPTSLRDARSYRVRIGRDVLPQQNAGSAGQGQPTPAVPKPGAGRSAAAAPLSTEAGWQPLADGGLEYIIQISPDALDSLLNGHEIVSDVPNSMRDVRSCRIHLGKDALPRKGFKSALQGEPTLAQPKEAAPSNAAPANDVVVGGVPAAETATGNGPTLASPTVRGQGPDKASETLAQARARRARELKEAAPRRLDDETLAEDAATDYGAEFTADPFNADRGNRVAQAQYREHQPTSSGSNKTRLAQSSGNKGSQPGNSGAQKPTRGAISDDEDEPERSGTSSSSTRNIPASSKSNGGNTAKTGATTVRTTRTKDLDADEATADSKPWFTLTMALIALFASLGGNWYLGWMNWDLRNKYQQALNDRKWRRDEYEPSSRVA